MHEIVVSAYVLFTVYKNTLFLIKKTKKLINLTFNQQNKRTCIKTYNNNLNRIRLTFCRIIKYSQLV